MAKYNKCGKAVNTIDNMVGKRFGRLVVQERYPENSPDRKAQWVCLCDCGATTIATGRQLRSGMKRSCGCLRKDGIINRSTKHGYATRKGASKIYKTYQDIIRRCYNPKYKAYHRYGGSGITVCDEWRTPTKGFLAFKEWAESHGYNDDMIIERHNMNGPFSPDNCKVVPKTDRVDIHNYTKVLYDGEEELTIIEFCAKYGYKRSTFYAVLKNGWSINMIIFAAKHPDLRMRLKDGKFVDSKGFIHLVPKIDQSKVGDPYGKKV